MSVYYEKTIHGIDRIFRIENKRDWLESKGGRTYSDILDNNDGRGEYVTMTNGYKEDVKVFIPKEYGK